MFTKSAILNYLKSAAKLATATGGAALSVLFEPDEGNAAEGDMLKRHLENPRRWWENNPAAKQLGQIERSLNK